MKRAILGLVFGAWAAAAAQPALAYTPYFEVAPSSVMSGQTANGYGSGYCPASSCSPVSITVESSLVASGVQVGSDGKFHATFQVSQFPGTYHVTAKQTLGDGSTIQATYGMTVLLNDNRTSPPASVVPPSPRQAQPTPAGGGSPPAVQPGAPSPSPSTTGLVAAAPTPSADGEGSGRQPAPLAEATRTASPWPWVVAGLVVLAGLAAAAAAWRRRRARGEVS